VFRLDSGLFCDLVRSAVTCGLAAVAVDVIPINSTYLK
jgi:hypothetical protein